MQRVEAKKQLRKSKKVRKDKGMSYTYYRKEGHFGEGILNKGNGNGKKE